MEERKGGREKVRGNGVEGKSERGKSREGGGGEGLCTN